MISKKLLGLYAWFYCFFRKKILVIGDSHANVFKHKNLSKVSCFQVVSVEGATISGLNNPNSITQAGNIFEDKLNIFKRRGGEKVIFLLGEVDTGFVIWYHMEKYGKSLKASMETTVEKYIKLLSKYKNEFNICVISTPLPTIKDNEDCSHVGNLRKSIRATQLERTRLTLELNKRIFRYCKDNDILFISLDKDCLGEDGVVQSEYINENIYDHHYNQNIYSLLILNNIKKFIKDNAKFKQGSK